MNSLRPALVLSALNIFCATPDEPVIDTVARAVAKVQIVSPSTGLSVDTLKLEVGDTGSVACRVTNQSGAELKKLCAWTSLTATRATVSPASGQETTVRGVGAGTTRVTATAANKADTLWVVVTSTTAPGITIAPGENAQAKVDANPANTVFRLLAGTHARFSVIPKSGDQFVCDSGAVMDGQNVSQFAVHGGTVGPFPNDITIKKCEAKSYATPQQLAVFMQARYGTNEGGVGWVIDSNVVHDNAACGIRGSTRGKIRGNYSHHNGTMGISGLGDSLEVSGNEIAFNNPTKAGLGFESGGTKFVLSNGLILRNNFVHHNNGPGLWLDIDNDKALIENNRVEDQLQEGIAIEISYSAVIRNNIVRRNGLDDARATYWPWGAGISIAASGGTGIEVYGNTMEGNAHGFAMIQQNRGSGRLGPYLVQNINAHDNTIVMQDVPGHAIPGSLTVSTGVDDANTGLYDKVARNIQVDHNTITQVPRNYTGMSVGGAYGWANAWRNLAQWRGYGFDVNSTITP